MTEPIFWELIEIARERTLGDFEEQTALLVDFLLDFTLDDISDFAHFLREKVDDLASTETFAAFYFLFDGEPSASYYFNFRVWLVAQGRSFFEEVLESPYFLDLLIGQGDKEIIRGQAFSHVPHLAYFVKTRRQDFPDPGFRESAEVEIPITEAEIISRFAGRYPRLKTMFQN